MQLAFQGTRIWIGNAPVDFRCSINGLAAIVAEQMPDAHIEDSIFVFFNKGRDKIKILGWHRNGYVMVYKRLEHGRFTVQKTNDGYASICEQQFSWLIAGLDWVEMSSWNSELTFKSYH